MTVYLRITTLRITAFYCWYGKEKQNLAFQCLSVGGILLIFRGSKTFENQTFHLHRPSKRISYLDDWRGRWVVTHICYYSPCRFFQQFAVNRNTWKSELLFFLAVSAMECSNAKRCYPEVHGHFSGRGTDSPYTWLTVFERFVFSWIYGHSIDSIKLESVVVSKYRLFFRKTIFSSELPPGSIRSSVRTTGVYYIILTNKSILLKYKR